VATSPVRVRGGCRSFPAPGMTTVDERSSWLRLGRRHTGAGGEAGGGGALTLVAGWGHDHRARWPPVQLRLAARRGSSSPGRGRRGARSLEPSSVMEGSALSCAGLEDEGRRVGGAELTNHHHGARGRAGERPDHDERCRWQVPDVHAHSTGGGETEGNGKVEQRGS
jgi:hypothetical protein